jgi:hypothetical protein
VEASGVRIRHPNREKPQSKATKAAVMLLLVASAGLIALVLIGGYEELAGATLIAVAYVVIYLLMAYFVARWSRGVLPMAAGLAIIFTTFAAVAAPAWFARDKDGFTDPLMPAGLLGVLVLVVIAVQVLLIIFAMRGFQQEWNIEVEVHDREDEDYQNSSDDSAGYEAQEGEPGPDEFRDDTDEHAPPEASTEDEAAAPAASQSQTEGPADDEAVRLSEALAHAKAFLAGREPPQVSEEPTREQEK